MWTVFVTVLDRALSPTVFRTLCDIGSMPRGAPGDPTNEPRVLDRELADPLFRVAQITG